MWAMPVRSAPISYYHSKENAFFHIAGQQLINGTFLLATLSICCRVVRPVKVTVACGDMNQAEAVGCHAETVVHVRRWFRGILKETHDFVPP